MQLVKACYFETKSSLVYLFFCIEDLSLLMTGPPQLLLLEVGIIQSFGDLHACDVNFGVCCNDKLLVSPAQWNSVQSKRAYEYTNKKTQMLEEVYKSNYTVKHMNYKLLYHYIYKSWVIKPVTYR